MSNDLRFNKTRIAPTPSGFLHLGNVLSFAITAVLAQKTNAKILLRIDDLDRERVQERYVQDIFDTLNFLEIPWHEGPRDLHEYNKEYSQLCRMELYEKALQQLKERSAVFACKCSRTQIVTNNPDGVYTGTCLGRMQPLDAPDTCWRLNTAVERQLSVKTLRHTITTTLPPDVQYFVVRKKDGFPAYQLASVVDDEHFGVDLIVRGEDLWHSTLAQHYLARVLDKEQFLNATFYHHPLLSVNGEKLSKSAGATSVQYLRKEGKKPADIFSMIAAMLGTEMPVNNWDELISIIPQNIQPI